jgi:hypothetical protein
MPQFCCSVANPNCSTHQSGEDHPPIYSFDGEDDRPFSTKLLASLKRPYVIFVQPIVLTVSPYQGIIFGTIYSIYTNMQEIYFNSEQRPPVSRSWRRLPLLQRGTGDGVQCCAELLP